MIAFHGHEHAGGCPGTVAGRAGAGASGVTYPCPLGPARPRARRVCVGRADEAQAVHFGAAAFDERRTLRGKCAPCVSPRSGFVVGPLPSPPPPPRSVRRCGPGPAPSSTPHLSPSDLRPLAPSPTLPLWSPWPWDSLGAVRCMRQPWDKQTTHTRPERGKKDALGERRVGGGSPITGPPVRPLPSVCHSQKSDSPDRRRSRAHHFVTLRKAPFALLLCCGIVGGLCQWCAVPSTNVD